jgi:hypothetical protein
LPLELPAYYLAGLAGVIAVLGRRAVNDDRPTVWSLVLLLTTSLVVAWLLVSTVGNNNDLGWRAILPAVLLLGAFAAAGVSIWVETGARAAAVIAAVGILLGLPEGIAIVRENVVAEPTKSSRLFAMTPELWGAVRQQMSPTQRLANNPQFLSDLTPWPINMSWALLANRRSCFAAADLALPFAPIPTARRQELEEQFNRVFAGAPKPDDIAQMANRYNCDIVVVTPQDGAWLHDPFASTLYYRLVESRPDTWRIYKQSVGQRP